MKKILIVAIALTLLLTAFWGGTEAYAKWGNDTTHAIDTEIARIEALLETREGLEKDIKELEKEIDQLKEERDNYEGYLKELLERLKEIG